MTWILTKKGGEVKYPKEIYVVRTNNAQMPLQGTSNLEDIGIVEEVAVYQLVYVKKVKLVLE